MILFCGKYSQIIILFENSTLPILEPIVMSSSRYSSININVDLVQNYNNNWFVSTDNNELEVNIKILRITMKNKLNVVGLILVNSNETPQLSNMIYDKMMFIKIIDIPRNDCIIYNKLLYSKTKDFEGEKKYVYFTFDPTRTINLTSRNNDGKEVFSVGGRETYLASLIPRKFNITLQMCTIHFSADHMEGTYGHKFFADFMEKTYEADGLTTENHGLHNNS